MRVVKKLGATPKHRHFISHALKSGVALAVLALKLSVFQSAEAAGWVTNSPVFVNDIPSASSILRVDIPPINLTNPKKLPNGAFQISFKNLPGLGVMALAATNLTLPLSSWTTVTGLTEISPSQFKCHGHIDHQLSPAPLPDPLALTKKNPIQNYECRSI
jgi:hypothetical protein